jgi:AcrR family transcriptional regulator
MIQSEDNGPLFRKLKPGPGLPADQVHANQRMRLHWAAITLVDAAGWDGVKVRPLAQIAGISTGTFYKHFASVEDCLEATYDAVAATTLRHLSMSRTDASEWGDSLRAAAAALLEDFAGEPRSARLALIDIFAAGPDARRRHLHFVREVEEALAASFPPAQRTISPPRHLVAGMTAGVLRVARATTLAGRSDQLPALADELGDWMAALPGPDVLTLAAPPAGASGGHGRREARPFPGENPPAEHRAFAGDRERLLRAAIKLAAVGGFATLSETALRAETGVSRRRFDKCFNSLEDCFLAAVEMVGAEAVHKAAWWSDTRGHWARRTCRLVLALCAQGARNRPQARLVLTGIFGTGLNGLLWHEQVVGRSAHGLRQTVPIEHRPSPIASEASVAAVWHIARSDVAAGRARGLPSLAPLLSYVILAPIIGARTASVAIHAELGTARAVGSTRAAARVLSQP